MSLSRLLWSIASTLTERSLDVLGDTIGWEKTPEKLQPASEQEAGVLPPIHGRIIPDRQRMVQCKDIGHAHSSSSFIDSIPCAKKQTPRTKPSLPKPNTTSTRQSKSQAQPPPPSDPPAPLTPETSLAPTAPITSITPAAPITPTAPATSTNPTAPTAPIASPVLTPLTTAPVPVPSDPPAPPAPRRRIPRNRSTRSSNKQFYLAHHQELDPQLIVVLDTVMKELPRAKLRCTNMIRVADGSLKKNPVWSEMYGESDRPHRKSDNPSLPPSKRRRRQAKQGG